MTGPEKKTPHITIRLKPRHDFSDGAFCPLTLPTGVDALFLEPHAAAAAVERVHAHLTCRLAPGEHAFGLRPDEPLIVRIPEDFVAEVHLACARLEGARTPRVTSLEIEFNRPLQLDHVLPTLVMLPRLFDDHDWSNWRDVAKQMGLTEIRSAFSRFADNLGRHVREGVEELGDPALQERLRGAARTLGGLVDTLSGSLKSSDPNLPCVHLSRVRGLPRTRAGRHEIDFAFTGELGWPGGRVLRRFEDVVLPKTLIPSLHGELADLLTAEPMSSANLRLEQVDGVPMARSAARMLSTVEGAWKVEIRRPSALFEARLHDHARLQVEAGLGDMTISGTFEGKQEAGTFTAWARDLELESEGRRLFGDLHLRLESGSSGLLPCEAGLMRLLGEEAGDVDGRLRLTLRPESTLGVMELMVRYFHPHVRGGSEFPVRLDEGVANLDLELATGGPGEPWSLSTLNASTRATFAVSAASINDGRTRVEPETLHGTVAATAGIRPDGGLHARLEGDCAFTLAARVETEPLPELGLEEGLITTRTAGTARFDWRAAVSDSDPVRVDFDGSRLDVRLTELGLTSSGTTFTFPAGMDLAVDVDRMSLDATGSGLTQAAVSWSLNGASPVLARANRCVDVLVPALWDGRVRLEVDPLGHLEIAGHREGLYDAHFWNALINPGSEPARWVEIFLDEAAMDKVVRSLEVFHADGARLLDRVRRLALRARDILDEMGVRRPGDFLPAHRIAAFTARLSDGRPAGGESDLERQWHEVVLRAVTGGGLDVPRVRRLIDRAVPEHPFHFELDRLLRVASMLLSPTEPVPPAAEREALPLALLPEHDFLRTLPSAGDLIAVAEAGRRADPGALTVLAGLAHYLTLEQLRHLLAAPEVPWRPSDLARIRLISQLKERVAAFSEHFGGVGYLLQPWALSFFLGEAAEADLPHHRAPLVWTSGNRAAATTWQLDPSLLLQGVLGPHDLAVLLRCGLAATTATRTVQVNQHLLWSLLARAPRAAVRQVLCVLGEDGERLLSHVLYGLLNQPRDLLRQPVDRATLLEEATGVPMPRQADYLAQGRRARDSYYEALSRAAAAVLDRLDPERALFTHLREVRHPAPPVLPALTAPTAKAARDAIAHADRLAAACTFSPREKARRQKALAAHEAAVEACRAVLAAEPRVVAEPWLKAYLARHFEALQVLSVVRNHQEDIDRVRPWLTRRSGRDVFEGEQDLLRVVIDALYHDPADREAVWVDPLARLLWDPPARELDFSVVSCMGVITEGSRGTELAETFARLLERRGVATVRADTATARSLDYNADRAIEAIEGLGTPYGLLGYSQGCANALRAEARMMAGPPRLQALAAGLRGRMFLFSAINGSAHGTCGDWKLYRAMVELDRVMKHYQGVFSGPAIAFVLRNLGALLDSRAVVQGFGGMASLSYEGVVTLAREGQFRDGVPTCMLRGIVEEETRPEALDLLASALTAQLPDPRHDTQVQVEEAVGHFTYVRNPWADVLRRMDLGARIQATHHWSPLLQETAFLTTDRDRERCIYDVPKDRHVFPWVDLMARFGFIGEKKV